MSETFRAFIAFDLPERILSFLAKVQQGLKAYGFKVKWVRPENIHLTLKFLGNTDTADTDKILGAISNAVKNTEPLSLAVEGIGVFPDVRRPRIIWAGLKGQMEVLLELQRALDGYLMSLGFPKETRPFRGHLTLGRIKGRIRSAQMDKAVQKFEGFESDPFKVNEIFLFKSDLKPTGAVYSKVRSVSFG
jgi:2'-5' RNA ligase